MECPHCKQDIEVIVKARKLGKRFVIPTPDEVKEYADSLGFPLDVERFFLVNEQNKWCVGKSTKKMASWKLAVQTWFKNYKQWNPEFAPEVPTSAEDQAKNAEARKKLISSRTQNLFGEKNIGN